MIYSWAFRITLLASQPFDLFHMIYSYFLFFALEDLWTFKQLTWDQCVDPDVQKQATEAWIVKKKTSQLQSNMIREDALNVIKPAGSHINKELAQKSCESSKDPTKTCAYSCSCQLQGGQSWHIVANHGQFGSLVDETDLFLMGIPSLQSFFPYSNLR